jgi:hypothetical protein
LLIKSFYADQLSPASEGLIDDMLATSYQWFYPAAMSDKAYYPNAYLGDLVCAKLIQEIVPCPADEVAALNEQMLASGQYWKEHSWGWGEHLSDTYAGVCMDLFSQYLICTKDSDSPVCSEYKKLLADLLYIEDQFEGGPRVPAIRSYAFASRTPRGNYRDRVKPWNLVSDNELSKHFWREAALVKAALYDAGWHERIEPQKNEKVQNVSIPCFDGAVATALVKDNVRLGSISKYPLMPTAENLMYGLIWSAMPVAFWMPSQDWAFYQWEVLEDGQVRAHPENHRTGARALTSMINPPIVYGKTYSIQRGGDVLSVRIMPAIMQTWESVSDSFKIADCSGEMAVSTDSALFNQLLLQYPDQTVSICNIPSESSMQPVLEKQDRHTYWKLTVPEDRLSELESMKMIVDVWGISLNGKITEEPVVEFQKSHLIPLTDAQQKRRLTWQWPGTKWDVMIDPMAEEPLLDVTESEQ